jgi:hypothetical protein
MKIKSVILILIGLMISSMSFGQKEFNKNYKIGKKSLKLSLIPISNERNSFNDTIMIKIFDDGLKNMQLISPFETREIIISDLKVQNLLNKIISTDYKKKDLKAFPNLNTIIEKSDINYLKERLDQTDLVLIPIALNFKPILSYTFGYTKFRMYDLNTGEFIFEFSDDINVNTSGENAMKGLTGVLMSVTHDYYKKNFLKKYNIE